MSLRQAVQRCEGKTETTLEKLAIPATGHAYGTPVWKWNDDFTASATFTCANDDSHVKNVTATVTNAVTTAATCETTGVRTYTAKVTFEGEEYTDTKTEVIPATGHDTELWVPRMPPAPRTATPATRSARSAASR